jgi:RNA polymerase sigma factor (sigma-70 family)
VYQTDVLLRGDGVPEDSNVATAAATAFGAFYRAELGPQVRRALLLVGDNETANDVVHDAMTAIYRRWSEIDAPGPYLNRAVLNGCRDVHRRRASARRALRLVGRADDASAEVEILTDALARLPFNHRAAIVLRFYAGFTTNEIAEALGCRPGSVGPWIERGLRALRGVL